MRCIIWPAFTQTADGKAGFQVIIAFFRLPIFPFIPNLQKNITVLVRLIGPSGFLNLQCLFHIVNDGIGRTYSDVDIFIEQIAILQRDRVAPYFRSIVCLCTHSNVVRAPAPAACVRSTYIFQLRGQLVAHISIVFTIIILFQFCSIALHDNARLGHRIGSNGRHSRTIHGKLGHQAAACIHIPKIRCNRIAAGSVCFADLTLFDASVFLRYKPVPVPFYICALVPAKLRHCLHRVAHQRAVIGENQSIILNLFAYFNRIPFCIRHSTGKQPAIHGTCQSNAVRCRIADDPPAAFPVCQIPLIGI